MDERIELASDKTVKPAETDPNDEGPSIGSMGFVTDDDDEY